MLKLNLWSCHGSLEVDVLEKRVQKLEEEIIRNQVKISNAVEALKDILDKLSLNKFSFITVVLMFYKMSIFFLMLCNTGYPFLILCFASCCSASCFAWHVSGITIL